MKNGLNDVPISEVCSDCLLVNKIGTPLYLNDDKWTGIKCGEEKARFVQFKSNGESRAFTHMIIYVEPFEHSEKPLDTQS